MAHYNSNNFVLTLFLSFATYSISITHIVLACMETSILSCVLHGDLKPSISLRSFPHHSSHKLWAVTGSSPYNCEPEYALLRFHFSDRNYLTSLIVAHMNQMNSISLLAFYHFHVLWYMYQPSDKLSCKLQIDTTNLFP